MLMVIPTDGEIFPVNFTSKKATQDASTGGELKTGSYFTYVSLEVISTQSCVVPIRACVSVPDHKTSLG